jgi:modulator of FtsH protease HflK
MRMAWNEPDNQDNKKKDQWKGKSEPPDLDEAIKKFQQKLKRSLGVGKGGGGSSSSDANNWFLAGIVFIVALILWGLSGIFIVDPAERAVILRFGKYIETVGPGPHWIPRFIESKVVKNVERLSDYSYSAQMLTKDENIVSVSLVVQYRIGDLEDYLFNVSDPQESLQQATASALRQVVGHTSLDQIITEGREVWGRNVEQLLVSILTSYKAGIKISSVSPQPARAPEKVQDAFDDAIKAQEDEKRFKNKAEAYAATFVPVAEGKSKRILADSQAFATQVVLKARGDVAEYLAILPEYLKAPVVTSERMYIDTMQLILSQTSKVLIEAKSGNLFYMPLDKIIPKTLPLKPVSSANQASTDYTPVKNQQAMSEQSNKPLYPTYRGRRTH